MNIEDKLNFFTGAIGFQTWYILVLNTKHEPISLAWATLIVICGFAGGKTISKLIQNIKGGNNNDKSQK